MLLDCSHLFHKQCLDNFEKFEEQASGMDDLKKDKHSCPMCRHPNYKKIAIKL